MVSWYLGTMGYSYKDWIGVFYQENLKSRNYLSHYSKIFNAVEMDNTFYGTPKESFVHLWRDQTPDDFTFCPKTPRIITHELRLENTQAYMEEFVNRMRLFRDKLGPILIQFPPDFTTDEWEKVAHFLSTLPGGVRYVVEFRHLSWDRQETADLLSAWNVCWASTDYIIMSRELHVTTDFIYIRFLGRHGTFARKNRIQKDVSGRLQWWLRSIQTAFENIQSVYGFFNNDFSGHSPATCNQFKRMAGLPVEEPKIPKQGTLF